jgi:hypothetical protein
MASNTSRAIPLNSPPFSIDKAKEFVETPCTPLHSFEHRENNLASFIP